jgi:hypothetical protein
MSRKQKPAPPPANKAAEYALNLRQARSWAQTAKSDLLIRGDRIDALDSVEMAIKQLQAARQIVIDLIEKKS